LLKIRAKSLKILAKSLKIPKYLRKILENLDKNGAQRCLTLEMALKVCRKTTGNQFLEVTPQKRSAKVARQLFVQVWENLGKNPLHPHTFACSYTYATS